MPFTQFSELFHIVLELKNSNLKQGFLTKDDCHFMRNPNKEGEGFLTKIIKNNLKSCDKNLRRQDALPMYVFMYVWPCMAMYGYKCMYICLCMAMNV